MSAFIEKTAQLTAGAAPGTMLYPGICERYQEGTGKFSKIPQVTVAGRSAAQPKEGQAAAMVFVTNGQTFRNQETLSEELFGPATLMVRCQNIAELEKIAGELPGQLTATIHGTEEDLAQHKNLVALLQQKVGRLIFNGFPTGVEVCPSMHHGGPYPASTDSRFTAVGPEAIKRFTRPVCFQNFPPSALPPELQDKNVRGIWRTVDGKLTREDLNSP
jgi:NADP-dependent aldehyde dehydrogenase